MKKSATKTPTLPLMLRVIARQADPGCRGEHPELAPALAAARRILRSNDEDWKDDALASYVDGRAKRKDPKAYAALQKLDLLGDVQVAYEGPALYLGIALAYVMLTADGAR